MALAEITSTTDTALNGVSTECNLQEDSDDAGISVFKEYMLKLLPFNVEWTRSTPSSSMNGIMKKTLTNGTTCAIEDLATYGNGTPDCHQIMKNGSIDSLSMSQQNNDESPSTVTNTSDSSSIIKRLSLKANHTNSDPKDKIVLTSNNNEPFLASIDDTACPLEIAVSDTVGRYLRARRNISAGEVLYTEPPVALATRPKSPPHCSNCYKLTSTFKCTECGFFFCGPECMTESHKRECQLLKCLRTGDQSEDACTEQRLISERLSQMPAEQRAQAQALIDKAKATAEHQKHLEILQQYVTLATLRTLFVVQESNFYKRLILLLQANLSPGSQRYQMNQKLIVDVIVKRMEASADSDLVHRICSIWDTNAFQVVLPQNGRVQGLYPLTALINHDCRPNAQQWFTNSGDLILRATDHISKGETVTLSYTDPQWSTIVRQNHLQKCKQFTCTCRRCLDPTELGTFTGSLLCPNCASPLVSSTPLDITAPWVCTSSGCSQTIQAKELLSIGAKLGAYAQRINPHDVTAVGSLARVLQRQVHRNHFSLMQLYMSVVGALAHRDLSELSDEEVSRLSGITAHLMEVVRALQSPLARITATVAREDLRLQLESIKRNNEMKPDGDAGGRLEAMKDHLQECIQVLEWDPSMPSASPLLQEYQNLLQKSSRGS